MFFELVDTLQRRQRLLFVALFIIADIWLLAFCTQTLQAHRSNIDARIRNAESAKVVSEYAGMADSVQNVATTMEIGLLKGVVASADGIAATGSWLHAAGAATLHAIGTGVTTTGRAIGTAVTVTGRAIGTAVVATVQATGKVLLFMGRILAFPFIALWHGVETAFGATAQFASTHLNSVIKPKSNKEIPVITPEQAEQVALIQKDTIDVEPIKPKGFGGACDNGFGNGGYPMEWCDAPMDTLRAKAGSNSRINRQCTSYAHWYFTEVLGHKDFEVWGDAKRWANASNYPVHQKPAVNSIAVETTGVYGHVAIVHALPGQEYEGAIVPAGYVLVSEMNYDWRGHFRYSYSPVSKFSAFIYR
jgi:hypothetical protein